MADTGDIKLDAAAYRAIEFLRAQSDAGGFADFDLPTGASNQWMTAWVAVALGEAAARYPDARALADRASDWLVAHQTYVDGFGFNERTGPDADSTAYALLALLYARRDVDVVWYDFLESLWCASGGFATYPRDDAWGDAHACVTPVVATALHMAGRRRFTDAAIAWLLAREDGQGGWPAYWWRNRWYADWMVFRFLNIAGRGDATLLAAARTPGSINFESMFDLACILGREAVSRREPELLRSLRGELVRLQNADGSWPASHDLRVTDPACHEPWIAPAGAYYHDERRIFTTAAVLRAIAAAREI